MKNLTWRIGDTQITRIVEGEWSIPVSGDHAFWPDATPEGIREISWLSPNFVTENGELRLSFHSLLIETPSARIIVDTCLGNDKVRHSPNFHMLQTGFLDDLRLAGWSPESVTGVLCTHLHVDHVGWNTMLVDGNWVPTFPNAKYYFARTEFEFWKNELGQENMKIDIDPSVLSIMDVPALLADSILPVENAGLVALVETDAQITPEIRLMPTPGHTPGHVSIVIESQGERAVITGDMAHHPMQMARPAWSSILDTDRCQAHKSRVELFEMCVDTPTLIIGTHFASPTAGHLIRDGNVYRFIL